MPATCEPILRHVLRDEALTRGLGDAEARMLVEWVADWTELLADAAQSEEEAWHLSAKLCRRARAIARFVALWDQPRGRGAATQLAAAEGFRWPLPTTAVDPPDLMRHILDWENEHPSEAA
jgi:hypothetical protein